MITSIVTAPISTGFASGRIRSVSRCHRRRRGRVEEEVQQVLALLRRGRRRAPGPAVPSARRRPRARRIAVGVLPARAPASAGPGTPARAARRARGRPGRARPRDPRRRAPRRAVEQLVARRLGAARRRATAPRTSTGTPTSGAVAYVEQVLTIEAGAQEVAEVVEAVDGLRPGSRCSPGAARCRRCAEGRQHVGEVLGDRPQLPGRSRAGPRRSAGTRAAPGCPARRRRRGRVSAGVAARQNGAVCRISRLMSCAPSQQVVGDRDRLVGERRSAGPSSGGSRAGRPAASGSSGPARSGARRSRRRGWWSR